MGQRANFSTMFSCRLLMYSIMGCSTAASSAATTGVYYQSLPAPHVAVIPVIRLVARCWNPSSTFIISPVTTQLLLPYSSIDWVTALYIIPRSHTFAPVFSNTLAITPPPPPAFALSSGYDPLPANHCCYRRSSDQGKGRHPTVSGPLHWSVTRPYFPQSSAGGYCRGVSAQVCVR